ncbi:aldolase catalytic domain-containing protein [Metapseudomonas otitidis]|uniref:aldolase catalytic domain-containing protein n=1 Tax=Metapseudomonas otitidis TaxID=319939 RepID=UPI003217521B
MVAKILALDCTLRDGGYYNSWDFPASVIHDYLQAMCACGVDIVELGLRSLKNNGFSGACAYSTDTFLRSLAIPDSLIVGVMINASELVGDMPLEKALELLFPVAADESPVDLVRVACHVHEFERALPAAAWLKDRGYRVGFNLMQVAHCSQDEVQALARQASGHPIETLYFADSMGGMNPEQVAQTIQWLRSEWRGALGIHTHDNMGLALANTLHALSEGVTWVDVTVTGMGRGPGNARTEELAIELAERRSRPVNLVPLMALIRSYFKPLQQQCGWGTNPYYYLAGKYGIHPTYVQEMLSDTRYSEEDVLAVIEHLKIEGGRKFNAQALDAARHFYQGEPTGNWRPYEIFAGREVLLLGSGPGVAQHREAIEVYIRKCRPLVLALNTQSAIAAELIDYRVACHPVRLRADFEAHAQLPQPLITPLSMLPSDIQLALNKTNVLDFGLKVAPGQFVFNESDCILPSSLVVAYALAIVTSGKAAKLWLAGFDGYGGDDPRSREMQNLLDLYRQQSGACPMQAVTATRYTLPTCSVYAL